MARLKHYDDSGLARFVTFCCFERIPSLDLPNAKEVLLAELNRARTKHGFRIIGYVLMPDHVHLVILPPDGMKLGLVIREIKSRSAKAYFAASDVAPAGATRVFWQRRCFDHNCRTIERVREKVRYCHHNPVMRGLVTSPGDWEWSSYNWYRGRRDVPLVIDDVVF